MHLSNIKWRRQKMLTGGETVCFQVFAAVFLLNVLNLCRISVSISEVRELCWFMHMSLQRSSLGFIHSCLTLWQVSCQTWRFQIAFCCYTVTVLRMSPWFHHRHFILYLNIFLSCQIIMIFFIIQSHSGLCVCSSNYIIMHTLTLKRTPKYCHM